MRQIYLNNSQEQKTTLSIYGEVFDFRFYEFRGLLYVDVRHRNQYVVSGKRVFLDQWILPQYLVKGYGNVRFEAYKADQDDYISYEQFNTKFRLILYSSSEIEAME